MAIEIEENVTKDRDHWSSVNINAFPIPFKWWSKGVSLSPPDLSFKSTTPGPFHWDSPNQILYTPDHPTLWRLSLEFFSPTPGFGFGRVSDGPRIH